MNTNSIQSTNSVEQKIAERIENYRACQRRALLAGEPLPASRCAGAVHGTGWCHSWPGQCGASLANAKPGSSSGDGFAEKPRQEIPLCV